MMQAETKLLKQFDQDGDGRLNLEERKAARTHLGQQRGNRGPGGFGGPRGGLGRPGESQEPVQPGIRVTSDEVKWYPDVPVYDALTVRTFFLEFENVDWEKELADFNNTDVEVPSKLTVDGKVYREVGVHFRGQSSYMMVPEGRKRSLNLSLDWVHEDQSLGGYRTFNLLNAHEDPTFLRAVLYMQIAREYLPAPKANFVRVVINGEDWGIYVSLQQFNKDFVKDWFDTTKGARWKVPGSPNGRAGLEYLGDDPAPYERLYEIKTKNNPESWAALINLCQVLNQTPADKLEAALEPILDLQATLKFLALENVMVNGDGYWTRASDYSIYLDRNGRFHIIPYDANETFKTGGGPGGGPGFGRPGFGGPRMGRGRGFGPAGQDATAPTPDFAGRPDPRQRPGFGRSPGGGGVQLDPLVAMDDASKPLLSKLLAVPALRRQYLGYVREIAERWLDWDQLGPVALRYQALIAEEVKIDTRKLDSFEAFQNGVAGEPAADETAGPGHTGVSLKSFAEQRRAFLLNHAEVLQAAR
jgi:spore coat protein CotH